MSWNIRESGVAGVTEYHWHGPSVSGQPPWAADVIKVSGRVYLAQSIAVAICGGASAWCNLPESCLKGRIKYGPGGRRLYVPITDQSLTDLIGSASYERAGGANTNEQEVAADRATFLTALIEVM